MKEFNFEKAVKRYNNIMMSVCYEHSSIGTSYSEGTENWNIRDMVAECDYVLSTYYEDGHIRGDMRYGDVDERKLWRSETGKLKRFIEAYKPFINDIVCTQGHCSSYDNQNKMKTIFDSYKQKKIDALLGEISNLWHERDGAAEFHEEMVPVIEQRIVELSNQVEKIKNKQFNEREIVETVVYDWLSQSSEELDVQSSDYKEMVHLVEVLCHHEFAELHDVVFGYNDRDLIFRNKNNPEMYNLYYYNPDSNAGGQIVRCPFYEEDAVRMVDNENYIDVLGEYTQYLSDINSEHFFNTIFELLELKQEGYYLGDNVHEVCRDILSHKDKSVAELIGDAVQRSAENEGKSVKELEQVLE